MLSTLKPSLNALEGLHCVSTKKPLNRGHLWVLKNLSIIKRCPLLGGSLTKIVTIETKHFVHYSRYAHYLGCPLLGFTVPWHLFHILLK